MPVDYQTRFQAVVSQLNNRQALAVEQIEGPVLVLAGPGTGKTHILAARIGRILEETDALPHNILCLTFTEAGVHAMRSRLIEFIGPDAHRVHIFTFHSFANRVIQDNMHLFGTANLQPVTDLERLEIIHELLDDLDSTHPLKQGKSKYYFYAKNLQHLFSLMKMERWKPERIHQAIREYLEDLPNREEFIYKRSHQEFKRGDIKIGEVQKVQHKMDVLRAAADCYHLYLEKLEKRDRYDFDDMIGWTLDAFKQYPWLLRRYQEQYLYLLVDEYQDTNGAQNDLIIQLIEFWGSPNIFIVGDDDQSIYEFQGARLHHLQDFYKRYKDTLNLVVLNENYRSVQPILNLSEHLISFNQSRAIALLPNLNKHLLASNKLLEQQSSRIAFREFPGPLQELAAVLSDIEQLIEQGEAPGTIAVIYAKHKQAELLIELFKKKGLPYATRKNIDLLQQPLVRQVLQVLRWLNTELERPYSGEDLLIQILHHGYLGIRPSDIARLSLLESPDQRNSWRNRIQGPFPQEISEESQQALIRAAIVLDEMLSSMSESSLPALLERWINRSGLLGYLFSHQDADWHIQVLHALMQYFIAETTRYPSITLGDLLESLAKMEDANLQLQLDRHESNADGVQFLTAHSSKGLEFKHVFIIDCIDQAWAGSGGKQGKFSFPDTLTYSLEDDALEARRRLFFVAMTRAKTHLYVSWGIQRPDGKSQARCRFIDELLEVPGYVVEELTVSPDILKDVQMVQLMATTPPVVDFPDDAVLRERLKDFRLSVSGLNSFLECPLAFYFRHFLKLPTASSEAAAYGIAVHRAIQQFSDASRRGKAKGEIPGKELLIQCFVQEMNRRKGVFSSGVFAHRLASGQHHLDQFFDQILSNNQSEEFLTEYSITDAVYQGVPLSGTIDRIDMLPSQKMHLTDYKTGTAKNPNIALPSDRYPDGGNYWRQMVFYKILVESHGLIGRVAHSGDIQYVDPDKNGQLFEKSWLYEPQHTEFVGNLITSVWKQIQNLEFKSGCGQPNCTWCNLLRNRQLPVSLSDEEFDGLDDKF